MSQGKKPKDAFDATQVLNPLAAVRDTQSIDLMKQEAPYVISLRSA